MERVALAPSVKQTNVRLPALLLSLSCVVKSQDPLSEVNVKLLTLYQSQQIFKSPLHSLQCVDPVQVCSEICAKISYYCGRLNLEF